jgi:pimeloyl-[acyl-carrier protein] synthase
MAALNDEVNEYLADPSLEDPAPLYRRLREESPVHHTDHGFWLLSRYGDVRDSWVGTGTVWTPGDETQVGQIPSGRRGPAQRLASQTATHKDPPDHTRLRALADHAFTRRHVERIRTQIQLIVDRRLDELCAHPRIDDLVSQFCYPLPVEVIAAALGLDESSHDMLERIAVAMKTFLDAWSKTGRDASATAIERYADETVEEFREAVASWAEDRRRKPGPDLLSAMVHAEEDGEHMSFDELTSMCFSLTAAGHETTANLIGSLVLLLSQRPEQWALLRADPSLIANAVEEGLRYESPYRNIMPRYAVGKISVGDTVISAGGRVVLMAGAANRDAKIFDDPDTFDIGRLNARNHLAFGSGRHFCLGSALARMEAQIALDGFARRLPELTVDTPVVRWRPYFALRGLESLPLLTGSG